MNLYELNKLYGEALSLAITDDGEIQDESLISFLDEIQEAKETKLLNIACLIKNLEAEEEAFANEIKKLNDRKKRISSKIFSLQNYLKQNIQTGEKISDTRAEISWRSSSSVELDIDIDFFARQNPHFVRTKYEPNKDLIKKAIKDGSNVIGASIVERKNMVIK